MPDTPLNPDALAQAKAAGVDCRINGGSTEDVIECAVDAYLAVAQPVLDETALANLIAWKSLPFGATQFVKLDANAAHKVIELLKPHLAVAQPEVNSFDPRELNRKGWTCGCEPGNYDSCDECQSACNELANFLNRPEVDDA